MQQNSALDNRAEDSFVWRQITKLSHSRLFKQDAEQSSI